MDTVSNALTRIKNGYLASKNEVFIPYSKLVLAVVKILREEGYLKEFSEVKSAKNPNFLEIKVELKYEGKKKPVIEDIKRISKPGLRIYKNKNSLPKVLNGLGIAIISTPKGVMTSAQAKKAGVGGEVLAYVW